MADFVSSFWSLYVAGITIASIALCVFILWGNMSQKVSGPAQTMGHTWDETLAEYNNPLPSWWIWLFVITIVFAVVYLVMYPGLGSNKGTLGWSSHDTQYTAEMDAAAKTYDPIFNKYLTMPIEQVAGDPAAHQMGERMFLTYCSQCHGSDARGGKGFPNLTDKYWQFGGTPDRIEQTILGGRQGVMPAHLQILGTAADVSNMANYVMSLSGGTHDAAKADLAKDKFAICAACHGADGKGNIDIGSPDLTDKDRTWLYGHSLPAITETITNGRTNQMPSFKDFLGPAKVHLLAAYVWSLSNSPKAQTTALNQ